MGSAQSQQLTHSTVSPIEIPSRIIDITESPLLSVDDSDLKAQVPVQVIWNGGGKTVFVTGTFNGWKERIKLEKSDQEFSTIVQMAVGTQHLKFIVDDEWKCSQDLPIASDKDGNLINFLIISFKGDVGDGLDDLSESLNDLGIKESLSSSPPGEYSMEIPSIYTRDTVPLTTEEPLPLPIYLETVLLNNKLEPKDPTTLQTPSHVALNHLYTCSIRDNMLSIACTSR